MRLCIYRAEKSVLDPDSALDHIIQKSENAKYDFRRGRNDEQTHDPIEERVIGLCGIIRAFRPERDEHD